MNNFSPSTDTSVGTKRFTAQEVQLAYTLMAVEYMKTILFIAAPIEEMNETMQFTVPERKVIPINTDPFVFQVTPIGVMIHSKWGVEAEDNIFDNIKPL